MWSILILLSLILDKSSLFIDSYGVVYTELFFLCFIESSENWFFLCIKLPVNGEEEDLALKLLHLEVMRVVF